MIFKKAETCRDFRDLHVSESYVYSDDYPHFNCSEVLIFNDFDYLFVYVGYDKALYRNFKFFPSGYKRIVEQYVVKLNSLMD